MTPAQMAMLAAGAVLVIVSVMRSLRLIRAGLAVAGMLGLYAAVATERPVATAVAALLVAVNLLQLVLLAVRAGRAGLSAEEARMAERVLPRMDRVSLRALFDQGLWIDGRAGETLIREGEPAPHLFYLSDGEARVESAGRIVASVADGHFLGEVTVLTGAPATGTVTLAAPSRFWCVGADVLGRFLAANPGYRPMLETAFAGDVGEKLRRANARMAGAGDGAVAQS